MGAKARLRCETCGNDRVVIAQYGISLREHGLGSRFCSGCLHDELKRLGLRGDPLELDEPADEDCVDAAGDVFPEHDFPPREHGNECRRCGAEAVDDV